MIKIRDILENPWVVGILILTVFAGVLALVSHFGLVEGAIRGDGDGSDCEPDWFTPTNPDTGEPYTSKDALREDVAAANPEWNETRVNQYMDNVELRDTENGSILQKQEVCA